MLGILPCERMALCGPRRSLIEVGVRALGIALDFNFLNDLNLFPVMFHLNSVKKSNI